MTDRSLNQDRHLDEIARWAGYLGLLPFAAALALAVMGATGFGGIAQSWALAQAETLALAWGAIILTSVAAVHWGLALAGTWAWSIMSVLGSILPSVVALAALLVQGVRGLALLVEGFGLFWLYEHRFHAEHLSADYLTLRRHLTLSVSALLVLTAFTLDAGARA